jgi:hypothetical protein
MQRLRVISRVVLAAALVAHALMAVFVIASRIRYPHDLEWMTGSVLDHVERVRNGVPVYTAPTARWIPFLYPPLFYWLGKATSARSCRQGGLRDMNPAAATCLGPHRAGDTYPGAVSSRCLLR